MSCPSSFSIFLNCLTSIAWTLGVRWQAAMAAATPAASPVTKHAGIMRKLP